MSQDNNDPIYRTSPERTLKMMVIMLGICIAGGAIFFAMWDYWISAPPPVVAMMAGDTGEVDTNVVLTGTEIPVSLSFVESDDFRTLAFNSLPGEPDNNPTITAEVGDKIIFDVVNDGISFHAFGVTLDEEGFGGIITGSEIASASNPLKAGESGSAEFVPPAEGVYYYICTVPGHRTQGMVGQIIVGEAEAPAEPDMMEPDAMEPDTMEPDMMEPETAEPDAMGSDIVPVEYSGVVSIPAGSGVVGCERDNACYIPADILVSAGDEVTWSNDDNAAHTVTSGTPAGGDSGEIFDSGLLIADGTFSVTFEEQGAFPYYCIVHPWMTGSVTVE